MSNDEEEDLRKTHCGHRKRKPHYCPYQADVNNDAQFECTCCKQCEQQCADDI